MRNDVVILHGVSDSDYNQAADTIRAGGVVAFPTETSYGLAADPFSEAALQRLLRIKKRSENKAFSVLIGSKAQLKSLVLNVPRQYKVLMQQYWPGPLTLIFKGNSKLPSMLTAADATIGIRISSHPTAMKLVRAASMPITATSANISGKPAAMSKAEVVDQFDGSIDMIIADDIGLQGHRSTIIGLEDDHLKLVRPGVIPFDEIQKMAGMF